jgi:hypothetical protein
MGKMRYAHKSLVGGAWNRFLELKWVLKKKYGRLHTELIGQ